MVLHNSLRLYTSADTFTLEPVYNDPSIVTENVIIQRSTGEIRLNAPAGRVSTDEEVMTIFGVIGFIHLLAGEYMVVITDRSMIGRIGNDDIFKVKDYKVLPLSRSNIALSEAQIAEEASYLSLLHAHLQSGQFHYSYTYELTHSLQRQASLVNDRRPIWERADERFFWNYHLQTKFIEHTRAHKDQDLSNFILPIMNGFAEIKVAEVSRKPLVFALFSRRSRHRAGTRYFSRGTDAQGNVSNFNETEQVVVVDGAGSVQTRVSHVQTRGSIPIYWTQINNIKYTPKLKIFDNPTTESTFRRHFETQKQIYGPQLVISLINKKGYEAPMGQAFSRQIEILNDPDIKYLHFDFHHECSKMRWHRLSILVDHFQDDLVAQGYFKAQYQGGTVTVLSRQTSVARTNCMDCLDRTNVVQSVISRWVLNRQLRDVGILSSAGQDKFEDSEAFEVLFRNVWADNADVVSCAYSGTGALKTDFTRTGKRTKAGALQDLQNSIVRYVKNNFLDGHRQDAYALFLEYDVQDARSSGAATSVLLADQRALQVKAMPLIFLAGFAMVTGCLIIPENFFSSSVLLFTAFWIAVMGYVLMFILANGEQYVNWPRLQPLSYAYSASNEKPKAPLPRHKGSRLGASEIEMDWKNE